MGEGVRLCLHLLGDQRPADAFEFSIEDDCQEQILVRFVIPLRGGHCCDFVGSGMSLRREARKCMSCVDGLVVGRR